MPDWEKSEDYTGSIELGALCMIRLYESYQFWTGRGSSYIYFIENYFRQGLAKPDRLDFFYQAKDIIDVPALMRKLNKG